MRFAPSFHHSVPTTNNAGVGRGVPGHHAQLRVLLSNAPPAPPAAGIHARECALPQR